MEGGTDRGEALAVGLGELYCDGFVCAVPIVIVNAVEEWLW